MIPNMRTTIDLDEDVLQAAKEIAKLRGRTAGQIVSDLARQALMPATSARVRNGVPLLPTRPGAKLVTLEDVTRLQDEE